MKRLCVAAALVLAGSVAVLAQESPENELDFVKKLRAKGYYDLTKEYIDGLRKRMPNLAGQLDLEQARALVAMAREKDLNQRSVLFSQAADLFNGFVKKFDGKPEAIQARLELAKLVAYHGQALLTKALREEEPKEQHEAARPAEAKFIQAGKQLEVVIKQLEDKEQIQARFDRGVNYIDQARTYLDLSKDANNRRRSELINEAKKAFEELSKDESSEVGLLANAWLIKCYQEFQDPQNVLKYLKRVTGASGKAAEPAQRLARYFYMQWAPSDPAHAKKSGMEKIKVIQVEGRKWLADHKGNTAALRSWEGQGVRFELAGAILAEAQGTFKDLESPGAATLLGQAQKLYAELADLDGDFSEESGRRGIFIAATRLAKTKLEDIRDFENAYLKAHVELKKLEEVTAKIEDAKDDKERAKLTAAKKQHLRDAIRAVYLAKSLADQRTPVQKVDDASWLLTRIYYSSGDLARAAIAGEDLATYRRPPTKRAPQGAGVAFLALDAVARRDPSEGNRQRLRDLAEFVLAPEMQKYWNAEPITSVARYQMAMLFEKDDNYKGAIEHLEKIPSDFGGFLYAQGQLTFIALSAARDKAQSEDERLQLRKKARAAIERMPAALPGDADPSTALIYFLAQMELAKFVYADAAALLDKSKLAEASEKYKEMGKFVDQHYQTFTKSKIGFEDEKKTQLDTLMTVLKKYSRLGLAEVEYRLGNYDKVLGEEFAGPVVKQVLGLSKKEGKIRLKDYKVVGDVVGLALRASIQKGDLDGAKKMFEVLDRLTGLEDGLEVDNSSMMRSLLADMEMQVTELKRVKNLDKLKTTTENFSKFIDDVADTILKGKAVVRDYVFLGKAYGSLEQYKKAADLYGKVPAPKALDNKVLNDEEKVQVNEYWGIRLELAKVLREAKETKQALTVLNELLNHKNGQFHILAEFEKNFIYQDNNLWGAAIKSWGLMIPRLAPRAATDTDVKKLYFDAYYYNTYCWYKYSQSDKIKATPKEDQALASAANYILRLENATNREGWTMVGPRFEELLDSAPSLKATYQKLKGATK